MKIRTRITMKLSRMVMLARMQGNGNTIHCWRNKLEQAFWILQYGNKTLKWNSKYRHISWNGSCIYAQGNCRKLFMCIGKHNRIYDSITQRKKKAT